MSKYQFSVGDEVNGYRYLGGDSTDQENWEPVAKLAREMSHAPGPQDQGESPGLAKSFGRGMLSTIQSPLTMSWNMAAWPSNIATTSMNDVTSMMQEEARRKGQEFPELTAFQPPQTMTGMELPEALGMPAPQTQGERFAELAGATALPAAGTVGLAARSGHALPALATELASLGGAHVGQEVGGTPGMIAGSLLPFGAGGVARQVSGAAPSLGSRAAQQRTLGAFERQGVPATIGDITDIAYPQKAAGTLPGGYGANRRIRAQQAGAMERRIEQVTGGAAASLEPEVVGDITKKGLGEWVDNTLRGTARKIDDQLKAIVPGDTPTYLTETKALLEKTIADAGPFSKRLIHPELRGLSADVAALESGGGMTFDQLLKTRSTIGAKLSSASLITDIPRGQLKQLYGALSKDLEATGVLAGGDRARQLFNRRNNWWKKGMERFETFLEPILKKATPEEAFISVQKAAEKGPTRIGAIAKSLNREQKETLIGGMLREMGQPIPSQRSLEYTFSPETFATNLGKVDQKGWATLTRGTRYANERYIQDLKLIASRLREVDKVLRNPSGTSYAILAGTLGGGGATAAILGHPVAALGAVSATTGGAYTVSKLMSSPSFVRWVAQGSKMPASMAATHAARLNLTMAEDAETRQALIEYMDALNTQ